MINPKFTFSTDIHQTTSCLYKDRIGSGSSCDVYLGYEKSTGKIRALKILKDRSWDRELMKEADSLMTLKRHPNIVEYYGKEKDILTKQSCLIIEYCSGGSLHTFLKEVPNLHGLPDTEFFILLDHITSGLEHLRQHNCIHRDIKPGNILRHVTSDKRTIYKLSDFGASRIMRNCEEEFMSLAGTEEYLHPAMYEKAFVDRKSNATFNHSADLWSLGCTLYQAATGTMPFVPFDGARNNRTTMYEMVACKPHSAISGSQTSSDSPISWNFYLPTNSNMTRSLQKYIVRVLVGLLEADPSKQWSFVQYKNTVTAILKLKYMVVLNCDDKTVHEMYIHPTSSLVTLEDEIARVTDIPAGNQKLYFHQHRLDVFLSGKKQIEQFPQTSLENPIILLSQTADINIELSMTLDPYPTFHTNSTIITDITTATSQCEIIHTVLKKMQREKCVINGLYAATLTMWNNAQYKHYRIEKKYQPWYEIYRQIRTIFDTTKEIFGGYIKNGMKTILEKLNPFEFYDRLKSVKTRIESTGHEQLSFQMSEESDKEWLQLTNVIFERSQELLNRMQGRKKSILNDYEICIHQADKIEMQELTARCIDYWQTGCAEDRKKAALLYSRNKRLYINVMRKMVEIERDLVDLEELRKKCHSRFSEILAKLLATYPDHFKTKQNVAQSKSLMGALPEVKPEEYSVKASKSSPLPRSPVDEIIEENKAYSFKIEDSINRAPDVFTVDLDDIHDMPSKTSGNQLEGRTPIESQVPEQKSPGHNSPLNVPTDRLSPGINTPVNQSPRSTKSPGNDSPSNSSTKRLSPINMPLVRQRLPGNSSPINQSPRGLKSPEKDSVVKQTSPGNDSTDIQSPKMDKLQRHKSSERQSSTSQPTLNSSPEFQINKMRNLSQDGSPSFPKQPCESSDIDLGFDEAETPHGAGFTDKDTKRSENSNTSQQIAVNKHVLAKTQSENKKMLDILRHKSNETGAQNLTHISSMPRDSGFSSSVLSVTGPKKNDLDVDAIPESSLEGIDS